MATNANKCFSLKSNLTSIKPICSSNFETNFNREKMPQTLLTMKFSTGGPLQADVLGREDYWPNNAFWLVKFRDAHRLISAVKQCKLLRDSQSKNLIFFEFSRVSPGAHPLTKKPEDSGYEIGPGRDMISCSFQGSVSSKCISRVTPQ